MGKKRTEVEKSKTVSYQHNAYTFIHVDSVSCDDRNKTLLASCTYFIHGLFS